MFEWLDRGRPSIPTHPVVVLAAVTHVVPPKSRENLEKRAAAVDRLRHTLEGLTTSFAHHDLRILINTYADWHVLSDLDRAFHDRIEVVSHTQGDPMCIEFEVPDLFASRKEDVDWFFFLEDDIVLQDPLFLDKLTFFNAATNVRKLLLPHRFEVQAARKFYIDLRWPHHDFREFAWNEAATFPLGSYKFSQCANSHSACFCLAQPQLNHWLATPRAWNRRIMGAGPLESAASGVLHEAFEIYKPHPANLPFLEVRHWHPTYSTRWIEWERNQTGATSGTLMPPGASSLPLVAYP